MIESLGCLAGLLVLALVAVAVGWPLLSAHRFFRGPRRLRHAVGSVTREIPERGRGRGSVYIDGEIWHAVVQPGAPGIGRGEDVRVVGGIWLLYLVVEPVRGAGT